MLMDAEWKNAQCQKPLIFIEYHFNTFFKKLIKNLLCFIKCDKILFKDFIQSFKNLSSIATKNFPFPTHDSKTFDAHGW